MNAVIQPQEFDSDKFGFPRRLVEEIERAHRGGVEKIEINISKVYSTHIDLERRLGKFTIDGLTSLRCENGYHVSNSVT